jgi:N-acyl-D-aspartate/D-glutamate deacylase
VHATSTKRTRRQEESDMRAELWIRGGTLVNGSGGAPFVGDVAVSGGRILAVGTLEGVDLSGAEEIDATGCIVTPGFVDIHTHYDGQAIWSDRLQPSSVHGVTTVVAGNCGVGFAPCRKQDQAVLIALMEGVEDIPGAVMAEGLVWDWETFDQYLDALDARPRDIDIAAYIPHSPLRVYVMGQRAIDREPANEADIATMRLLVKQGIEAGALGCATSRLFFHRTSAGALIPTFDAGERELDALAGGMADAGGGLLQLVPNLVGDDQEGELALIARVAGRAGIPTTFTGGAREDPTKLTEPLDLYRKQGLDISAQIYPRPIGMVVGLGLSWNPFSFCPSFAPLASLSAADRAERMRDPALRAALTGEVPDIGKFPLARQTRIFDRMFPLREGFDYEPPACDSVAALAERSGLSPAEQAYDLLLQDDGEAMLFVAMGNYLSGSLDPVRTLMDHPGTVLGLGDGGAHYGMICDASFPTTLLAHWVRDRATRRVSVEWAVNALSRRPAEIVGLRDRGLLAPGYRADLNVIALDTLTLHKPVVVHDLPAGGRRLMQTATGYRATIVDGQVTYRDGVATQALPGRLVRGRRGDPAPVRKMVAAV